MKYFCFLLIILYNCYSITYRNSNYTKINKSKDVDLYYKIIDTAGSKKINYYFKNKTNNTFVIDPFGYRGVTNVYENNKFLKPYKLRLEGYYERFSDKWCERDLIILKPHKIIKVENFNTNYNDNGLYYFSKNNNYYESVKSRHDEKTATYFGCKEYIDKLEKKGYKVLEDSINAKIPIFPLKFNNPK